MKEIVVLGSTGSIGTQTLAVVAEHPQVFRVTALAAGHNMTLLANQIMRFQPTWVSVASRSDAEALYASLTVEQQSRLHLSWGEAGLLELAAEAPGTLVVNALVGAQGIRPTLAALESGKDVALANKETMVAAGPLVKATAQRMGRRLLPIDSEHSAIFQCLQGNPIDSVARLWLTCSGGPFLHTPKEEMANADLQQVLAHPTWRMGKAITVHSATLMNKGLEEIEAHVLFDVPYDKISVVIHPQSIVHSLVAFTDGAVLAQLGSADMRIPISVALSYPQRIPLQHTTMDMTQLGSLTFEAPDRQRFPALELAESCGRRGGTLPAVLNAANEEAVDAFLHGVIPFGEIVDLVAEVVTDHHAIDQPDLAAIEEADRAARKELRMRIAKAHLLSRGRTP
ncbi:MAG: 1-deoxy-D-xylulose-5-phosphate reductoisomerase [Firmicutes bacterium]|nr:1-deoxy-D-xylulose-5-phosphate reductoisomerase [Bacillota bacterium]